MGEIVERAAKAFCAEYDLDPMELTYVEALGRNVARWECFKFGIRAVLEEISEPTQDMLHAGYDANYGMTVRRAWEAMIKEALR